MSDPSFESSTQQLPDGMERRRWQRQTGSFAEVAGRARLIPSLSGHYPSLRPGGWYKVIGQNREAIEPVARHGYLWIEVDGRPRLVWAGHFEVQLGTPSSP